MKHALKTVALAGLLGTGLMLAGSTSASASMMKSGCNGDGYCRTVECDDFGHNCITVRSWHNYIGRRYYSTSGYVPNPPYDDYDRYPTRHYVCDYDGDNCYTTYD
jgi:hypothetical protein